MFQYYFIERVKLTTFQFKDSGNGLHVIRFNIYFNTANLSNQEQRMKVRDTVFENTVHCRRKQTP